MCTEFIIIVPAAHWKLVERWKLTHHKHTDERSSNLLNIRQPDGLSCHVLISLLIINLQANLLLCALFLLMHYHNNVVWRASNDVTLSFLKCQVPITFLIFCYPRATELSQDIDYDVFQACRGVCWMFHDIWNFVRSGYVKNGLTNNRERLL